MGEQKRSQKADRAQQKSPESPQPASFLQSPTPEADSEAPALFNQSQVEGQAAYLKRLPSTQRPSAMQNIHRTQGNRHAQRVITALQPGPHRVSRAPTVQTKLTVSEPGDQYEQEADQVAEQVMKMSLPGTPPAGSDAGDAPSSPTPPPDALSRYIQPKWAQRAAADGIGGSEVNNDTQARIEGMQGGGDPLPQSERDFFEPRMGVDLGSVRVHKGGEASQTSQDLNARAYTVGSHVAFNEGEYQPGTAGGRRLLAHELTHVVQQGGAGELKRKAPAEAARAIDKPLCPECVQPLSRLQRSKTSGLHVALSPATDKSLCPECVGPLASLQRKAKPEEPPAAVETATDKSLCPECMNNPVAMKQARIDASQGEMAPVSAATPAPESAVAPKDEKTRVEAKVEAQPKATKVKDEQPLATEAMAMEPAGAERDAAAMPPAKSQEPGVESAVKPKAKSVEPPLKAMNKLPAEPAAKTAGPALATSQVETSPVPDEKKDVLKPEAAKTTELPQPAEPKPGTTTATLPADAEPNLGALLAGQSQEKSAAQGLPDLSGIGLSDAYIVAQEHAKRVKAEIASAAEAQWGKAEASPQSRVELGASESAAPEPAMAASQTAKAAIVNAPVETPVPPTPTADTTPEAAPAPEATKAAKPDGEVAAMEPAATEAAAAETAAAETAAAETTTTAPQPAASETAAPQAPEPQTAQAQATVETAAVPQTAEQATETTGLQPGAQATETDDKTVVVQRLGLGDLIPDWARGLLDSLRGDAGSKKGELNGEGGSKSGEMQTNASTKGKEIEGDGGTKGAELQADQETKGAELQADQETKGTEMEAEKEAKGAELQADQETKGTEMEAEKETKGAELQAGQETKGAELQADQETKSAEMQADQETKGAELQADQETKGAELQADQETKGAELQADQATKDTELQTDAESKTQELDQDLANSEQEAQTQEQQITQEVDNESTALENEAESASGQVENEWAALQTAAAETVAGLDEEANELCAEYQGKAESFLQSCKSLLTGGPQAWLELKQSAKAAWNGLMEKAKPILDGISQKWQQFSGWVNETVWKPLQEKTSQFGAFVQEKAGAAWNWIQEKWSWLGERWSQAEDWIHEKANAAREWITGKADAARTWIAGKADAARAWIAGKADAARAWIAGKADAARTWITGKADAARTWIADKAGAAHTWITGKAGAARTWIGGKADAARTWITGKADAARGWIGSKADAAQTWIGGKTTAAQNWIQGKANAAVSWFQSKGQGLVSGLSSKARSAVSSISSKGGRIGQWFGGIVNGLISGVESAGNSAVSKVSQALSSGLNFVESAASGAVGFVGNAANSAVQFIGDKANGAVTFVEGVGTGAVSGIETISTAAVNGVEAVSHGAVTGVEQAGTAAVNGLEAVGQGAVTGVEQASTAAVNGVEAVSQGVITGAEQAGTAAVNGLEAVGQSVVTGVENSATTAVQMVNTAWGAIQNGWDALKNGAQQALGWLQDKASQLGQMINQNIIQPVTQWLQEKWNAVKSWLAEKFPGLTTCWEVLQEFADAARQKLEVTVEDAFNLREDETALDNWEDQWDGYQLATMQQEELSEEPQTLENYQPSTGLGMFDATYNPDTNTLEIVLKCNFNFNAGDLTKWGGTYTDADVTWTEEEIEQWKADYIQEVTAAWSGNQTLYAQDDFWESESVNVNVSVVETDDNEHFTVNVEKIPSDQHEGSSVSAPSVDDDGVVTPGTVTLDSSDLTDRDRTADDGSTMQQRGAIHEAGHMLGLGDEYGASYGCHHAQQYQDRYGTAVVEGADGRIMSIGEDILPEHNLVFLEVMEEITGVEWGTDEVTDPAPIPPDPADCVLMGVEP
ncbi:MAG: DUF4157 domain-containing protein [Anaerolineae bacterium]|nr:DUF4157 domain-containing protein [Anaerolineae bacterium]